MNEPLHDELLRLSFRSELTPDERVRVEAFLTAHPELRGAWEEEHALSRALSALPDAPVSSNFTARVLEAVDFDEAATRRERERRWWKNWRVLKVPRLAWATLLLVAGWLAFQEYHASKRTEMGRAVSVVSKNLVELPNPELLQDFDAINSLREVSTISDGELLTALQ